MGRNAKRLLGALLIILMISGVFVSQALSQDEIKVYYNDTQLTFDVPPTSVNGRTLVPVKAIFEKLGATVEWDGSNNTVTAIKGYTTIKLQIDSKYALVNEKTVELDVPLKEMSGRTLVPIRFVSENLGAKVEWDSTNKIVTITYDPNDISNVPQNKIRNGKDTYTWDDGTTYDGEWLNNKINGKGVLSYASGEKYSGEFVNFKKSGYGVYTWKNGESYSGYWSNDKMSGFGTYKFINGDEYTGNWDSGLFNGQGTYTFKDGRILTGIWLDNQYSSED